MRYVSFQISYIYSGGVVSRGPIPRPGVVTLVTRGDTVKLWRGNVAHEGAIAAPQLAMESETDVVQQALAAVDRERSKLDSERCAFEEFREAVRLATPEATPDDDPSKATEFRDAYQSKVMNPLD